MCNYSANTIEFAKWYQFKSRRVAISGTRLSPGVIVEYLGSIRRRRRICLSSLRSSKHRGIVRVSQALQQPVALAGHHCPVPDIDSRSDDRVQTLCGCNNQAEPTRFPLKQWLCP